MSHVDNDETVVGIEVFRDGNADANENVSVFVVEVAVNVAAVDADVVKDAPKPPKENLEEIQMSMKIQI